jgi:branched-chain amino acid transport system permease protein
VEDLLVYIVRGFPAGCVYGLIAMAVVLTYKTSGVFNLAFGAQAYVAAALFYKLGKEHDWPTGVAAALAVIVMSPLLSLGLEYFIFRHMRTQPLVVKLVAALGLLTALPEITKLWFGKEIKNVPPSVASSPDRLYKLTDRVTITQDRLVTVIASLVVFAALTALFRYTVLGLRMRAIVESPRMVELAGVNANLVSRIAWTISGFLAGLAGVLFAHTEPQLRADSYTGLLVVSIAAAAFGLFKSIPRTLAGGMIIAIVGGQMIPGWLGVERTVTSYIRPSFPFLMLFAILVFVPGIRSTRETTDPLAGVDPPPPALAASYRDAELDRLTRKVLFPAFIAVVLFLVLVMLPDLWVARVTEGVCLAVIFLSITVLTGLSGQLSLATSVFAGAGAFTVGQLSERYGWNPLIGLVFGALIAATAGALVALPAMRLGGLYLAVATFALALLAQNALYGRDWVGGFAGQVDIPRPEAFGVDFADDKPFFILCAVILTALSYAVIFVRRGTTGRFLFAMRGSETAAAASAIDPVKYKLIVFAFSSFIAGVGGALLGMYQGVASTGFEGTSIFSPFFGLVFVVLVVTLGVRTIQGAIVAAMSYVLFPLLLEWLKLPTEFSLILFGFGAITFARHPEGIMEANTRKSVLRMAENKANPRLARRRRLIAWAIMCAIAVPVLVRSATRDAGTVDLNAGFALLPIECGTVWEVYTDFDPAGVDAAQRDTIEPACKTEARWHLTHTAGIKLWDYGGAWKALFLFLWGFLRFSPSLLDRARSGGGQGAHGSRGAGTGAPADATGPSSQPEEVPV